MGDLRLGQSWKWAQRWKNEFLFHAATLGLCWGRRLSEPARQALGRRLGRLGARLWTAGMRRAGYRLRQAFGEAMPVTPIEVFETLGADYADTLSLMHRSFRAAERMPLASGAKRALDEAVERGKGVIFLTAHFGPMDMMAASVAERGYRVATLARESYDPRFTAFFEALREPRGVRAIYRGRAGAEMAILRALRDGYLIGFPIDFAGRGMRTREVSFLGQTVPMAVGPAALALRFGIPVVVGAPISVAGGLQVFVEPFMELHHGDDGATVGAMARALEQRIRDLPAHWPWMHDTTGVPRSRALPDVERCQ